MKRRFPISVLLSGLFLAAVIGAAGARGRQGTPPGAPPPGAAQSPGEAPSSPQKLPPPLPQGAAPDLDLVFTNQVIGWIEPCG